MEDIYTTWEPAELRDLKQKLAKLSCKCLNEKHRPVTPVPICNQDHNHKEVQVEQLKAVSLDQFTQINPDVMCGDRKNFMSLLSKDVFCPSCFVTLNLLRGGTLRILKDEESETKSELFSHDKCTEKIVKAVEKTTSITSRPVIKFSNLTLCDLISECSSDISVKHQDPKRRQQVKFVDISVNSHSHKTPTNGACFCLDNFIEAIRPPSDIGS